MFLPEPDEIEDLLTIATPEEREQLTHLLELSLSLAGPLAYAQRVSNAVPFAHTKLLDQYLVALVEHRLYHTSSEANALRPDLPDGISDQAVWEFDPEADDGSGNFVHPVTRETACYNLGISMPPQHGKSFMVSDHLVAWYLHRYPDRHTAIISYEEDFATSWSAKVRKHIDDCPEYGLKLDNSTKAKGNWILAKTGGTCQAVGVGGAITGKSLHLTVMDDLIKNAIEALSETSLKGTQNWWMTTAKTRNQSPRWVPGTPEPLAGVRVLMHTRWSTEDLLGFVSRTEGDEWFMLNLPAIAEDEDPLGRPVGAALCPQLHSLKVLQAIRDTGDPEEPDSGGAFWFEAMYQGHPSVEGAGIFARPFHYFTQRGNKLLFPDGYYCYTEDLRHFITVDLAASLKTRADWTVFMEFAMCPDGRLMVWDIYREKMESSDHEDKLRAFVLARSKRPLFTAVENKTFGLTLIQNLMRNGGMVVRPVEADTDKISRAIPAGQQVRNSKVWWSGSPTWRKVFEEELSTFPAGGHDDMVDCLAYGVECWVGMPQRIIRAEDLDTSMEAKVKRHLDALTKKKKRKPRHPVLGS